MITALILVFMREPSPKLMLRLKMSIDLIIGTERETRRRRRVARKVKKTASKEGSMGMVGVSVQEVTTEYLSCPAPL